MVVLCLWKDGMRVECLERTIIIQFERCLYKKGNEIEQKTIKVKKKSHSIEMTEGVKILVSMESKSF